MTYKVSLNTLIRCPKCGWQGTYYDSLWNCVYTADCPQCLLSLESVLSVSDNKSPR
jgi:hypothetical protein